MQTIAELTHPKVYTRWESFRSKNKELIRQQEILEFQDLLFYLVDRAVQDYKSEGARFKTHSDIISPMKNFYDSIPLGRIYDELSAMPVSRITHGSYITTKTEWEHYLDENCIQIHDFSHLEDLLSKNYWYLGYTTRTYPLLLLDREYFSNFVYRLYAENPRLSREDLITFVYFLTKERTETNHVNPTEVAYKFHAWFLQDYNIHSKRIPFSSKESARGMLLEMCRDGFIKNIAVIPIEQLMGIVMERYFSGGINELRSILGTPPVYHGGKKYKTEEEVKEAVKKHLIENPCKRTVRDIQKALGIELRSYYDSLADAFNYAKIELPFGLKTREERLKAITEFIEKNHCTKRRKLEKTFHIDIRDYPEIRELLTKR